jgi:hypothetical protein
MFASNPKETLRKPLFLGVFTAEEGEVLETITDTFIAYALNRIYLFSPTKRMEFSETFEYCCEFESVV